MGDLSRWMEKLQRYAFELLRECTKGCLVILQVLNMKIITQRGVQWPFRDGEKLDCDERRLYEDGKFLYSKWKS